MVRSKLAVICALGLICGCRYAHINQQKNESALQLMDIFDFRKEMRLAYIDMCKREAQRDHGDYKGWAWDCSRDYRGTYRIVHVDARYLSFYVKSYVCAGYNAHGGTTVTVGTIDRKTGKVLKADDLIPEQRRSEVQAALVDGIAKKLGGRDNLLAEPEIIDNCYLDGEGVHFVYDEYDVAPYSQGPIDAVIQVPTDVSKPVTVKQITTHSIYDEE